MRKSKKEKEFPGKAPSPHGREAGAIAGEVAGAVLGSAAGPAGAIAGMVIGAAAGSLAGAVLEREEERAHDHDLELDEEIGVMGGDLGAVQPAAPVPRERPAQPDPPRSAGGELEGSGRAPLERD